MSKQTHNKPNNKRKHNTDSSNIRTHSTSKHATDKHNHGHDGKRARTHAPPASPNSNDDDEQLFQQQLSSALKESRQLLQSNKTVPDHVNPTPGSSANNNQVQQQVPAQQPSTTGMNTYANSWDAFQNPFVPPSINETHLKKIEDGKFIDFIDLLPDNQASDAEMTSDRPAMDIDRSTGIVRYKENKNRKLKVNTFQRWSTAWCTFFQAHLHYHPQDYYNLSAYHALFVQHINQYKYEACFKYDRDFRITIANQRNMDPTRQTCHWTVVNELLRIRHLNNNPLIPCTFCLNPGHDVKSCRAKNAEEADKTLNITAVLQQATQQQTTSTQNFRQQQQNSGYNQNFRSNNNNNNSNFRNSNQNNGRPNNIPPSQKHCNRFSENRYCDKSRCQFLHACQSCGSTQHGRDACKNHTSTNFIPLFSNNGC